MTPSQDEFVHARNGEWTELRALLDRGRVLHKLAPAHISRVAALYRAVCSDLMRAQANGYGPDVIGLLDGLAARAHNALYDAPPYRLRAVWELLAADFPRALRKHARFFALAVALFLLPGALGFVGAYRSRSFALSVLPEQTVEMMEKSYAKGFDVGRDADTDVGMAGFYVYNNVGIAFRCFATGILFGVGSAFFLVYNGLTIGVVAGLVTASGHGKNILTFTSTHGAFELTAIVISATAGMVMGYALIDTGGRTRTGSLRAKARDVANLVLGAAAMLLVAACLEGFWSPSAAPAPVKWGVAIVAYTLVTTYFLRAGREPREPRP
ncbi:MAG TPA: stage II sporulation protein M [Polyangia bacterium]|nr:stage II sporulation protein M [Polyangia bacterium]